MHLNYKYLLLFFALFTVVNAEDAPTKNYCLFLLYGNNKIVLNTESEHDIASLILNPTSSKNLPGFSFSFIKERNGCNDGVLFIQGFFKLGYKFIYLKSGLNIYAQMNPEDGPGSLTLPHAEIGIGQFNRVYISANVLSDILFGMGSINLNYIFNDNISSLMIGRAFGDDGNYQGFTYKVDYRLWKNIIARAWGNANFSKQLYGLQIGLGMTI